MRVFLWQRLVSKCFPHLTEELFADIKEKMATASLQNLRRAEIGHNAFVRAEGELCVVLYYYRNFFLSSRLQFC